MAVKVSGSFDARMTEYSRLLTSSASFGGPPLAAPPAPRPIPVESHATAAFARPSAGPRPARPTCGSALRQLPPKPVLPRPVISGARPTCLPHLQAVYDPHSRCSDAHDQAEVPLQERSPRQSRSAEPPQKQAAAPAYVREPLLERRELPLERRELYPPRDQGYAPREQSYTPKELAYVGSGSCLSLDALTVAPRSPRSPGSGREAAGREAAGREAARQEPAPSPGCQERRPARTERRAQASRPEALHRAATEEFYRSPPRTPSTQRSGRHADRELDVQRPRVRSIEASNRTGGAPSRGSAAAALAERLASCRRGSAPTPGPRQEAGCEEDCAEYSDRFLAGYDKGRLLGRGACAVVWLAAPTGQRNLVAVKQVAKGTMGKKKSDTEAARKEIFFGSYLFHAGGEPKLPSSTNPGIQHIAKLLDYQETKRDIWLVMEYGGTSLTKMAYEIKGEFLRGERLYRVNHLPVLQAMKQDPRVLGGVLRQLLSALCILADHHIVHSDIKPDNILVEEDTQHQIKVRFIDLGSAFTFDCPENLALATPEYMPPEALETCISRGLGGLGSGGSRLSVGPRSGGTTRKPADPVAKLQQQSQPWSFDIWSLGSIMLELCTGTPLWLSYKCRVADDQRANSAAMGLFAVPGRDPEKIMQKQADAMHQRGLHSVLKNTHGVPLNNGGPGSGQDLLSRMLAWDPLERISPHEALEHPWLRDVICHT